MLEQTSSELDKLSEKAYAITEVLLEDKDEQRIDDLSSLVEGIVTEYTGKFPETTIDITGRTSPSHGPSTDQPSVTGADRKRHRPFGIGTRGRDPSSIGWEPIRRFDHGRRARDTPRRVRGHHRQIRNHPVQSRERSGPLACVLDRPAVRWGHRIPEFGVRVDSHNSTSPQKRYVATRGFPEPGELIHYAVGRFAQQKMGPF